MLSALMFWFGCQIFSNVAFLALAKSTAVLSMPLCTHAVLSLPSQTGSWLWWWPGTFWLCQPDSRAQARSLRLRLPRLIRVPRWLKSPTASWKGNKLLEVCKQRPSPCTCVVGSASKNAFPHGKIVSDRAPHTLPRMHSALHHEIPAVIDFSYEFQCLTMHLSNIKDSVGTLLVVSSQLSRPQVMPLSYGLICLTGLAALGLIGSLCLLILISIRRIQL